MPAITFNTIFNTLNIIFKIHFIEKKLCKTLEKFILEVIQITSWLASYFFQETGMLSMASNTFLGISLFKVD